MKYDRAVFIGRFQPLHNGHLSAINKALSLSDNVIVLVGSARSPRTPKNPFTYHERKEMLQKQFGDSIKVMPLRDFKYDDTAWIKEVHSQVSSVRPDAGAQVPWRAGGLKTCIVGLDKDSSTYYLHTLRPWTLVEHHNDGRLDATSIRELYLNEAPLPFIEGVVPTHVYTFLARFRDSQEYRDLADWQKFIVEYKIKYPTMTAHCTVDSVVVQSGHVLLIRRGRDPGKGQWALPGGFLAPDETHFQSAVRELYEETSLKVPEKILIRACTTERTFDAPDRDLRGRTVSRAFLFKLDDGLDLPKVAGGDDAAEARWFNLADVENMEPDMYSDHYHIIRVMLSTANPYT